MSKSRVRLLTWILAACFFVIGFLWMILVNKQEFVSSLLAGAICAVIPLIILGMLLFAPPDSPRSPLRYMWRKPPTVTPPDDRDKEHVVHKPKGKHRP